MYSGVIAVAAVTCMMHFPQDSTPHRTQGHLNIHGVLCALCVCVCALCVARLVVGLTNVLPDRVFDYIMAHKK